MIIDDTETTDVSTTDAATDTSTETADTSATETVIEKPATGLAAFDKGLEELPESEGGKPAEAAKPVPGATGAAPAEAEKGATAAAAPAKELTDEEKAKRTKEALVEAELKKFNDELREQGSKPLAKNAAKRFRELSMRPTEQEVEHRIAKVREEFAPREELAQAAERMNGVIAETKANPEQIGSVFRYLKDINSGDPVSMKRAFDSMKAEVLWLAEQLGESVDGIDPLVNHPDLQALVKEGEMPMKAALEVVQARATKKMQDARSQAENTATQTRQQYEAAIAKRDQDIAALDAHLKKTDPHYSEKLAMLAPTFAALKRVDANGMFIVHPSHWAAAIKEAYAQIKLQPKPAAAPSPSPVRATGTTKPVVKVPKSGLEAFDMGLRTLSESA